MQVVNGVLLPISLFFIWRLSRNRELMGEHRKHGLVGALTATTVVFTSTLSLTLVAVMLAGT